MKLFYAGNLLILSFLLVLFVIITLSYTISNSIGIPFFEGMLIVVGALALGCLLTGLALRGKGKNNVT
jgi:hypothetical protein